jgi:probable rRNA maturation factor
MRVVVTDGRGRPLRARGLAAWLRRAAPRRASGSVSVAIVGDTRARALNRRYRRFDHATDVLSFPSDDPVQPGLLPPFLGDIVIARGVAARQARRAGHSAAVEFRILALHGLLHLLGYDHERDGGRMRSLERRLLRQAGVRPGLIDRTEP